MIEKTKHKNTDKLDEAWGEKQGVLVFKVLLF